MKLKFLAAVGLAATLYSCDDTTTGVGEFVADADEITASAQTFEATTKTLKYTDLNQNGVFSRTSSAYLGKFTDPDFGTYTTDFITQINCTEGFEFPETLKNRSYYIGIVLCQLLWRFFGTDEGKSRCIERSN